MGWGLGAAVVLVLLLLSASGSQRPCSLFGKPPETVALTLLAGATEKGAVCLDGTPPGYHLQRGSGDGANNWLIHLEDGSILHFRGLHIYEAVIDELMRKGLANATQNVREVLPRDCLANKEPTECFFPAELIKSIRTPMFILNSGYDSWQTRSRGSRRPWCDGHALSSSSRQRAAGRVLVEPLRRHGTAATLSLPIYRRG
ncbi:hypothetical protein ACQ4PT_048822 [Festuca glaucescens]